MGDVCDDSDGDGVLDADDACPERATFLGDASALEYTISYDTAGYRRAERVGCTISQRCPCRGEETPCLLCSVDDREECTESPKPWRGRRAWRRCVREMVRASRPAEGARAWKRRAKVLRRAVLAQGRDETCGERLRTDDDADGDGVPSGADNCARRFNPCQADDDRFEGEDGGNACDRDDDNDGVRDPDDNCRSVRNPVQKDKDEDGVGDACDACGNTASKPKHTKPNGCGPCQGENRDPDCGFGTAADAAALRAR
jgi:hypothetical protein